MLGGKQHLLEGNLGLDQAAQQIDEDLHALFSFHKAGHHRLEAGPDTTGQLHIGADLDDGDQLLFFGRHVAQIFDGLIRQQRNLVAEMHDRRHAGGIPHGAMQIFVIEPSEQIAREEGLGNPDLPFVAVTREPLETDARAENLHPVDGTQLRRREVFMLFLGLNRMPWHGKSTVGADSGLVQIPSLPKVRD